MKARQVVRSLPNHIVEGAWSIKPTNNRTLIASLRSQRIIKSKPVADTLLSVDRGKYCPDPTTAYFDQPQGIGARQIICAPYVHAFVLEILRNHLRPGARVLDIGSGSGFLTACFGKLVCRSPSPYESVVGPTGAVFGLERVAQLVKFSIENVRKANPEVFDVATISHMDGFDGYPEKAPYDVIYVGGAHEDLPTSLISQLKEGGRMLVPVGKGAQILMQVDNTEGKIISRPLLDLVTPPMARGLA